MVDINLGQARTELEERGFHYIAPSRSNFWLNRALVDFEDFWNWPWLQRVVTGAAPLQIADLKYILNVQTSTGQELFGMGDSEDLDITQTGTPENWWVDESSGTPTVGVWPVGTATLRVRYAASSATLSSDTDTPSIPTRYHQIWVDLAVVYAYRNSDNFTAAQQLRQIVNQDLQTLVERYETRNRQNSQVMAMRVGSEDEY